MTDAIEVYEETPVVEQLVTELLGDGRASFTITKEAAENHEVDITSTHFRDVDTGEVSYVIQFRLVEKEE